MNVLFENIDNHIKNTLPKPIRVTLALAILFCIYAYCQESFICNSSNNVCYSTKAFIKSGKDIKISEVAGITIHSEQTKRYSRRSTSTLTVYMPTLLMRNGERVSLYINPTESASKVESDKSEFINFIQNKKRDFKVTNKNVFTNGFFAIFFFLFTSL